MPGLFQGFEGYQVPSRTDVESALKAAVVAVDANILLDLYRYNTTTANDLLAILDAFGDRLVVPYQAIREFHRNRISAIGNPEAVTRDALAALRSNQTSTLDALARWGKAVALAESRLDGLGARTAELFEELASAVGSAAPDRVQPDASAADDRILTQLHPLLDGKVLARPDDSEWADLVTEGRRRVEQKIPPGYLDADKDDDVGEGAAGDFLVYRQASLEAVRRGMDLVIITRDEKEDWWWRHRSSFIGPRPEMTKEFFDDSGGHRLFLLRPRDLLDLSEVLQVKVDPSSAEEVGRVEADVSGPAPDTWTPRAVSEILSRLEAEGQIQAEVIRAAALLGGTIERADVYRICGYDEDRTLKGFTIPTNRITGYLRSEGLLSESAKPIMWPLFPTGERAENFRIPDEVVEILEGSGPELPGAERGKYRAITEWLVQVPEDSCTATFAELEELIGASLAPSARKYLPYWYSRHNSLGKAIALAGFRVRSPDLSGETATFVRR